MQHPEDANPLLGRCHAIVQQMAPSDEQLPAILERGRDVVLTAGAGAGKTRALIARYLSLLAEGLPLRSVVAITFTRKAAREMRNRARREIGRYVERPDLSPAERDRWQHLYSELDAARISTIHTLCVEILRSHPAEAGLDPHFAVLDEGPAALLLARAVEDALGWASDDPQAVTLFAALPENHLRDVLSWLLAKRLDAAPAFSAPGGDPLAYWRGVLGRDLEAGDAHLGHLFHALRAAFTWAADRYAALKAQGEALDFDDLEAGALNLLHSRRDVQTHWQAEIRALLVDEFQDTNARQGELIRLFNACPSTHTGGDGGRLFIVGDAKQSIYRFRGADVTVFRREREAIAARGGACLDMATSYRAHGELVSALNALLKPVLSGQADPSQPWVEPFAELRPYREKAGAGFLSPHVELQLTVGTKTGGALARAAAALAAQLREMVDSGEYTVFEDDREQPLRYSHIAVLCRASNSFPYYEDAFEAAGVPYLTVAGGGFYERPEIRDVLNALQALSDPTDDLALAGLLRSPAFALSDAGLYHLAAARGDEGFLAAVERSNVRTLKAWNASSLRLWDILRTYGPTLPGQDGSRAARAADLITDLHSQVRRVTIGDLLKAFLDATDYRAALRRTSGTRAVRNVAKLLSDARASALVGVGDFLETVAQLRESGTREGEARATVEGAAQIMSIHAAKGLEFPIVVIGDALSGRNWSDGVIIHPQLGVLLPPADAGAQPSAVYAQAKTWEKDQEDAESDRLLYVAATRAQERLIFSGCVRLKKDSTPGWLGNSWLGKVAGPDALDFARLRIPHNDAGDQAIRLELQLPGDIPVACTVYEPNYCLPPGVSSEPKPTVHAPMTLPPPLLSPVLSEPVTTDDRTTEQERDPGQRVWRVVPAKAGRGAPPWVIGKLVHEALAAWRFPDANGRFERWAEAHARSYGLTDTYQLAEAGRETRKLLLRFRGHSLYDEMADAKQRLHEVPYSRLNEDGQVESGIIDVLYRRDGGWTIVEFKTDKIRDQAELKELLKLEDYLPQAERYRTAVERLVGQRPQVILCFVDCSAAVYLHRS